MHIAKRGGLSTLTTSHSVRGFRWKLWLKSPRMRRDAEFMDLPPYHQFSHYFIA